MSPKSLYGKDSEEQYEDGGVGDEEPRCTNCNKLLAIFVTRPWSIKCVRCKANNQKP